MLDPFNSPKKGALSDAKLSVGQAIDASADSVKGVTVAGSDHVHAQ